MSSVQRTNRGKGGLGFVVSGEKHEVQQVLLDLKAIETGVVDSHDLVVEVRVCICLCCEWEVCVCERDL